MLNEIGPLSEQISEINVADPNNLIVAEHVDDRVVKLMLGEENYRSAPAELPGQLRRDQDKRPERCARLTCAWTGQLPRWEKRDQSGQ